MAWSHSASSANQQALLHLREPRGCMGESRPHRRDPPHLKERSCGHQPTLPARGSQRLQLAYEKPISPPSMLLQPGLLLALA